MATKQWAIDNATTMYQHSIRAAGDGFRAGGQPSDLLKRASDNRKLGGRGRAGVNHTTFRAGGRAFRGRPLYTLQLPERETCPTSCGH